MKTTHQDSKCVVWYELKYSFPPTLESQLIHTLRGWILSHYLIEKVTPFPTTPDPQEDHLYKIKLNKIF